MKKYNQKLVRLHSPPLKNELQRKLKLIFNIKQLLMRHKIKIVHKLLIFGIAVLLSSCSEDLYDELQNNSKSTYTIKRVPLNELAIDQKFNKAYKKVSQKGLSNQTAVFSRTQIENEYGFTIVDEPSNVMEYNSKTSYSLEIQMDSTQADELKNLVIEVNSLNESKHFIVTYKLDENAAYRLSETEPIVIEEIAFDPNLAVSSRWRSDCIEVTTIYCTAAGTPQYCGGADTQYGCYRRTTTLCGGSGSNNSSGFVDLGVLASPVDSNHQTGGSNTAVANPCNKIKNQNTKFPSLKQSLVTLATTTSQNYENGTFIDNTAIATTVNPVQTIPSNTTSGGSIPLNMTPTNSYVMIAHTHDSYGTDGTGTYSIFSWDDLTTINNLIKNNHIDTSNFVFYVITADGTRYALTVDSASDLSNFFYDPSNLPIGTQIDVQKMLSMDKLFKKYYDKKSNGLIATISNVINDKTNFLKFIKEANLGITLFEVDASFTNYQKLSISNSGVVTPTPCN